MVRWTWGLVVTLADHTADRFLTLHERVFDTQGERDAAWALVPDGKDEQPAGINVEASLLVDLWSKNGVSDNRYVTAAWVEQWTGERFVDLVRRGNIEADAEEEWSMREMRRRGLAA